MSRVEFDPEGSTSPDRPVRILEPEQGTIGVLYRKGDGQLPLVVATTARGRKQTELVADYIRRKFFA